MTSMLVGLVVSTACAGQSTQAVFVPSQGETACRLEGWVVNRDPVGLNVRAAPKQNARVLGTLPAYVEREEESSFGIPVQITGSKNGWLRIEGAHDDPARTGLPERPTYAGRGWVAGNMVRFAVQSGQGFERPDTSSSRVVDFGTDWLTDLGQVRRIIACSGDWALVEFVLRYRRDANTLALDELSSEAVEASLERAWFRGICGNQETTCDGLPQP